MVFLPLPPFLSLNVLLPISLITCSAFSFPARTHTHTHTHAIWQAHTFNSSTSLNFPPALHCQRKKNLLRFTYSLTSHSFLTTLQPKLYFCLSFISAPVTTWNFQSQLFSSTFNHFTCLQLLILLDISSSLKFLFSGLKSAALTPLPLPVSWVGFPLRQIWVNEQVKP